MDDASEDRLLVAEPQINEVMDLATGEVVPAESWVSGDYQQVLELRMRLMQELQSGRPVLACPLCAVPVHLVSLSAARRFYFRHESEDGRCPARTKGRLSGEQILAMKYDGARESRAHLEMKDLIAASLRCDSVLDVGVDPSVAEPQLAGTEMGGLYPGRVILKIS